MDNEQNQINDKFTCEDLKECLNDNLDKHNYSKDEINNMNDKELFNLWRNMLFTKKVKG